MSKPLTIEDIEAAAEQALKNFGAPNQMWIANGTAFMPFGNNEDLSFTVNRVMNHQNTTFTFSDDETTGMQVMYDAARAFHRIGFDPKPYNP